MGLRAVVAAAALACAAAPGAAMDLKSEVQADWNRDLQALFRDLHANPELGFEEVRTAAAMARELRAIPGMTVTEGVGKTGVVGVLANGRGPVLLIRADMDGLPVKEASGLPYAARGNTMHACGHDSHMVGLIAAARRLSAHRDRWSGTILFVLQPAEELLTGAPAMLKDGLYSRFPKPDYALAFHSTAGLKAGAISFSDTIQYASADGVDIIVPGVGTHGASPESGRDPIVIGAAIVQALQTITSRELSPFTPAVVTVGTFHAGTARNIIPDEAKLELTLRANSEGIRALLKQSVTRIAENVGRAHGLPEDRLPKVIVRSGTPVVLNDRALAERLRPAIAKEMGAGAMEPFEQGGMGSEDFAFFVSADTGVKGLYFAVGATPEADLRAAEKGGPPVAPHHSPFFKVDGEAVVTSGARAMTTAALTLLGS
jgi:hippurate hydrolase